MNGARLGRDCGVDRKFQKDDADANAVIARSRRRA